MDEELQKLVTAVAMATGITRSTLDAVLHRHPATAYTVYGALLHELGWYYDLEERDWLPGKPATTPIEEA